MALPAKTRGLLGRHGDGEHVHMILAQDFDLVPARFHSDTAHVRVAVLVEHDAHAFVDHLADAHQSPCHLCHPELMRNQRA